MTRLDEIVKMINESATWDLSLLSELCYMAGLTEEWENADGDTFESVAYKASEILGVEI